MRVRTLAIDIGGSKTAAALIEGDRFLEHASWITPREGGAQAVLAEIVRVCEPWASSASRCGVSFGGQFDFAAQTCIRSMHVSGWDDLPISDQLEQAFGIPVITDNDANVAALGEYQRAQTTTTRATDPLLYVTVSTGVGGAIIANGRLVRGAHSLAGELGHLPIGHDNVCNCGQRGCLERAVSGFWIERDHHQSAEQYLQQPAHHHAWIEDLARGLWSATMVVDPALIVVGGGMAAQGAQLLDPLRTAFAQLAHASGRTAAAIELGDPSGRTVLAGAAALAKEVDRETR